MARRAARKSPRRAGAIDDAEDGEADDRDQRPERGDDPVGGADPRQRRHQSERGQERGGGERRQAVDPLAVAMGGGVHGESRFTARRVVGADVLP